MADLSLRLRSPSAARNRDSIADVLRAHLPPAGLVVEIASGSGEHVVHFAKHLSPELIFQPSDLSLQARASIDAWIDEGQLGNVRRAINLDVSDGAWVATVDEIVRDAGTLAAIICINMIHIAPWQAAEGLIKGAALILPAKGFLFLYGPFTQHGFHTAVSNEAFDADLRARNPEWGVRDLETVSALAVTHGFDAPVVVPMPANNLTVVFRLSAKQ